MDIADEAQLASASFHRQAMANRHFDLSPVPPVRQDANGNALCVSCDDDITARRNVVPNAQRCAECQTDFERRKR